MLKNASTFSTIRTPSSYPASQKRYLRGSRADLRVPYREISLSATRLSDRTEENPPLPVYDTSGSYTDPDVRIELTRALPSQRINWIKERTGIISYKVAAHAADLAKGWPYSEGFRLRWDQVDWENRLIHFGNDVKTPGSSEPLPLTDLAFRVLQKWKEKSRSDSPYIFPSLRKPGAPVGSVKTTWRSTLRRAGVPHFPIYNSRHAFCARLSWVAPDAVIERAMRHTSPETKRIYQLSMVEQVREAMEKANQKVYGERVTVH